MELYLYVMGVLFFLGVVSRAAILSTTGGYSVSAKTCAIDLVINAVLLMWTVYLTVEVLNVYQL